MHNYFIKTFIEHRNCKISFFKRNHSLVNYCDFSKWPDDFAIETAFEPVVLGQIICPLQYAKPINQLCMVIWNFK